MNRAEFFSQIKKDLLQTVKEIAYPLVDDDIKKIERFARELGNSNWFQLGEPNIENLIDIEDRFINNRSVVFYRNNNRIKAIDRACPNCKSIISWISYEQKFVCLNCEKGFLIINEEGDLKPTFYNLVKEKNRWYISIKNG